MAAITTFGLLAAMVLFSAFTVFIFTFTSIAAATIFASPDHHFTGNPDVYDTELIFSLYTHVFRDT